MLTDQQRHVLSTLAEYVEAPNTRRLTDRLDRPEYRREHWTYDQVHSALRRLEKRGLVSRSGRRPTRWSVTDAGRAALGTT